MDPETRSRELRRALIRKGLAFDELRAALTRTVDLRPIELLAVQYLAYAGELTPSALAGRLAVSSSACTALVQRLDRARCVLRRQHPSDQRSVLLRLAPEIHDQLAERLTRLIEEIDAVASELTAEECETVTWFLNQVAAASELQALAIRYEDGHATTIAPHPGWPRLWA